MLTGSHLNKEQISHDDIFSRSGLISSISTRDSGNMSLVYGDTGGALSNRKSFLEEFDIDYRRLVAARQIHGLGVKYVTDADAGKGAVTSDTSLPDTDALITDKKNLPLAIFTADCLSVFIYDHQIHVIGLVHAGWKGTKVNITGKAINLMKERFDCRPENLYVKFGPAIRECCYEVGQEFEGLFSYGLIKRDKSYFLDLAGINKGQVVESGIKEERIFDAKECTSCRKDEFFSFRREGSGSARMISVMMLTGKSD